MRLYTLTRNQQIIQMFKDGYTLEEIGQEFGISRQRVQQITSREGVTGEQAGYNKKIEKSKTKKCKVDVCKTNAIGVHGYCSKHYHRVLKYGDPTPQFKVKKFVDHDGVCFVEGCDRPFKANGLCNSHRYSFYRYKQKGEIKDLDEYLLIQKAKKKMGKRTIELKFVREFIEENKELFA